MAVSPKRSKRNAPSAAGADHAAAVKAPEKTTKKPVAPRDARGNERRRRIFRALHDCTLQRGYARTTLADIAAAAEMSPSHLLYYFRGKDDVLEQYFESVAVRFSRRLDELESASSAQKIDGLADIWFRGEASTRQEIGFMLECFGAAVNDDVLRGTKADFDRRCKAFLGVVFAQSQNVFMGNARDASETAYALMVGLRSAVYFDDFHLEDAHRLFRESLRTMADLND